MPRRPIRTIDGIAGVLAASGVVLAVQAKLAGSLFRYQLAGFAAGVVLLSPLLLVLVLRDRGRRLLRRLLFAAVPVTVLLGLAELVLRAFGAAPPPPERVVADARLGHALQPGTGGTDARGFRNAAALERAELLVVGDSQTWGFGVAAAETFAARLGADLGVASYQMANGGYGPVHYRELVRDGLRLAPRGVVVAVYFGNDLFDAAAGAGLPCGVDLRAPGRDYPMPHSIDLDGATSPNWTMALVDGLLERSRLLGRAAAVLKARLRGGALDDQPGAVRCDEAAAPTVLLPGYRLPAVDPQNEVVRDGVRITAACLREIAAACRTAGVRTAVLLIPTKECAYAAWLAAKGPARAGLAELAGLAAAEQRVHDDVVAAARAAGLPIVDLLPECVAALQRGEAPWPVGADGHLAAPGHALAARALAAWWRGG